MKKGISLHLGLNRVDPIHYQGWNGQLSACEADARDMAALAQAQGFQASQLLLTRQVTADAVIAAISNAAKVLKSGDIFFLSYSGHGGQLPDLNGDESQNDRMDETWLCYDRELVDDELYALWAKFKRGVRIIMLSDSCHSGTVSRARPSRPVAGPKSRLLPWVGPGQRVYTKNKALYDGIQKRLKGSEKTSVNATVVLISGCQDNQESLDGARNGLFTGTLKQIWKGGRFVGSHRLLRDLIAAKMPASQTPNYSLIGRGNLKFEMQTPFTI